MSPAWKKLVRDRLTELEHDHRWLEGEIGAGRGMVTKMLSDEQQTSALVVAVCEALGIPMPVAVVEGEDEHRLIEGYRELSPTQRAHLLGLLNGIRGKPPE